MLKIICTTFFSLLLLLSSANNVYATHADSFTKGKHSNKQDYSYDGSDMARFVILNQAKERKDELMDSIEHWPEQQARILHNLTNDRDSDQVLTLLAIFCLMLLVAFIAERIVIYKMNRFYHRLTKHNKGNWGDSLKLLLINSSFQFLGLAIFTIVAGAIAIYNYEEGDSFRILSLHALGLVMKIRILSIILKLILAPYSAGLRLLKMECEDARRLFYSILAFLSLYLVITTFWRMLALFSLDPIMFALLVPLTGFVLNICSISLVWFNRNVITRMFTKSVVRSSNFTQILSQVWPTVITFWLLVIWSIWAVNEFLGNYEEAARISAAWWLTFSFPILDRIIFVLLSQLKRISWLQSHSYEKRCDIFIHRVIIAIRVIVLVRVINLTDSSFGYNAWEMLADNFGGILKMSLDVVVVLILAYALWEIIQSAIERHLPHDVNAEKEDDGLSSLEGDGGGSGASRSETLLPLVRSFLLVFLMVSVILTILSIMGVEIGPLLAGAGIIGIAVGFGAQKLVQDVISGIFFLLDDAFRRGEYIEAAGLRGTVERISVRSIRLRHHLGAVQTIPFSEIATVRNLSRDWITMKLEFRLDYRTDVEVVRKLIKKVGLKMLEHPEYGKFFLLPLKSQGVIRVEESALIFRMKFTCVPGEQWIIRREAFTKVKDSLKKNGIEFAHRSVHVLMHDKANETKPEAASGVSIKKDEIKDAIEQNNALKGPLAGAAASAVTNEMRRQDKIDQDFD
ncbi:MAG: small-conductance mechanosensitive channel [Oceanospirillaceae bacterium]|jgi:small-conductance mechanosensitive channel